MFAQDRHDRLLQLLRRKRRLSVRAVERALGVSPATIRRDLAELEGEGKVVRTHGGVIHPAILRGEPVFQRRARVAVEAKRAIARMAAGMVAQNATVHLDSGSTVLAIARLLVGRRDLTLLTNSIPILLLGQDEGARIISPGGYLRVPSESLVGALALDWMSHMRFDIAFIGASGLHPSDGASVTSLEEAAMKQASMSRATRSVLVCDSSKWDKPAAVRFAGWDAFDCWVVDEGLAREARAMIGRRGVKCQIATAQP